MVFLGDGSAMLCHYLGSEIESQPIALHIVFISKRDPKKLFKNLLPVFLGNSRAMVPYGKG